MKIVYGLKINKPLTPNELAALSMPEERWEGKNFKHYIVKPIKHRAIELHKSSDGETEIIGMLMFNIPTDISSIVIDKRVVKPSFEEALHFSKFVKNKLPQKFPTECLMSGKLANVPTLYALN